MQTAGAFEVSLIGTGTKPAPRPVTQLAALPGESATRSIRFCNPFGERASVHVSLDSDAPAGVLTLESAALADSSLDSYATLTVPVRFAPCDSEPARGTLVLDVHCDAAADAPVRFAYPLLGAVESDTLGPPLAFATAARQELREVVQLELAGYSADGSNGQLQASIVQDNNTPASQHGLSVRLVRASCIGSETTLAWLSVSWRILACLDEAACTGCETTSLGCVLLANHLHRVGHWQSSTKPCEPAGQRPKCRHKPDCGRADLVPKPAMHRTRALTHCAQRWWSLEVSGAVDCGRVGSGWHSGVRGAHGAECQRARGAVRARCVCLGIMPGSGSRTRMFVVSVNKVMMRM